MPFSELERLHTAISNYNTTHRLHTKDFIKDLNTLFRNLRMSDSYDLDQLDDYLDKLCHDNLLSTSLGSWVGHLAIIVFQDATANKTSPKTGSTTRRCAETAISFRSHLYQKQTNLQFLRNVIAADLFHNDTLPEHPDIKACVLELIVDYERQYNTPPNDTKNYDFSLGYADFFLDILVLPQTARGRLEAMILKENRLTPEGEKLLSNHFARFLLIRQGYYGRLSWWQSLKASLVQAKNKYHNARFVWYSLNRKSSVICFCIFVLLCLLTLGTILNAGLILQITNLGQQIEQENKAEFQKRGIQWNDSKH